MARVKFTHPNETKIGEIRSTVSVPGRQRGQLRQVILAIEGERNQTVVNHSKDQRHIAQMKGGFCQNRFAGQKRFCHAASDIQRPLVVAIIAIGKSDKKPGIGDPFHDRENPLRFDRLFGPRMVPAKRMNACAPLLALAFSN